MRFSCLALVSVIATSASSASPATLGSSIIDFEPGATHRNAGSFTEFFQGGSLSGESAFFDSVFFDCNLCDVTGPPDQQPGLFREYDGGFVVASGGNPGLFDVTFSAPARWVGGQTIDTSSFEGITVSGPDLSPVTVLTGLPDNFDAALEPFILDTPITFSSGLTYTFDTVNSGAGRDSVFALANFGAAEFANWEFAPEQVVVPLPATLPLLAAPLAITAVAAARRKRA